MYTIDILDTCPTALISQSQYHKRKRFQIKKNGVSDKGGGKKKLDLLDLLGDMSNVP